MIYKNKELAEVSKETFDARVGEFLDPLAIPVDTDDQDVIAMAAYEARGTGVLIGVMKITEDGTEYFLGQEPCPDTISEEEALKRIYGS